MARTRDALRRTELAHVLRREVLRELAGARSFGRGEDYFESGCVGRLAEYEGRVTASVQGTEKYVVKLWGENEQLLFDCTCPVGDGGSFCKHCVAVGLVWLANRAHPDHAKASRNRNEKRPLTMDAVRAHLEGLGQEALIEMLMERALADEGFREQLFIRLASWNATNQSGPLDIGPFLDAIDCAVDAGYVAYREVHSYARGIRAAVDPVENLIEHGYAAEALPVVEHALDAVERALSQVDDSDGYVGGILEHVADLHLAACKEAKPDGEKLAEWLFRREMDDGYGSFRGSVAEYAPILGKRGLARYRALAEEAWSRLPAVNPGQKDPLSWSERYPITAIMESLARASGDVDALIAVLSRDLSNAYSFLKIAELCKQHGKRDLALEWAERGVKAFPEHTDWRLREFLAEEYHRRKRHDEAMALVWKQFTEGPSLGTYQALKKHADRVKDWPAWRGQALGFVREHIARQKKGSQRRSDLWAFRTDHSLLVEMFLWEKDSESAWREAQAGGCDERLWIQLADERAKEHPEDALPIYQRQIEPTVNQKNNAAYEKAVKYLRIVRDLMNRLGRSGEFAAYLTSIRAAHKPKRNFMRLLERFK